jgi:hypothetical protein
MFTLLRFPEAIPLVPDHDDVAIRIKALVTAMAELTPVVGRIGKFLAAFGTTI